MKTEHAKLIEIKSKKAVDVIIDSLHFEINYEENNYDAGYLHALKNHGQALYQHGFKEGQHSPEIKKLEWKCDEEYYIWEANSVFGKYSFVDFSKFSKIVNKKLFFRGEEIAIETTVDAIKSAAQAHFEKQVKECLL